MTQSSHSKGLIDARSEINEGVELIIEEYENFDWEDYEECIIELIRNIEWKNIIGH